eukprot:SAG11_NODE_1838_length_4187_cov_3.622554_5_plen_73_part_00
MQTRLANDVFVIQDVMICFCLAVVLLLVYLIAWSRHLAAITYRDIVTVPTRDVVRVHEPKIKVDLTKYTEGT